MGCWNKTCGLSGLPIEAGQDVLVFAIEQNSYHSRTYTTALWRPVTIPFSAQYDESGGGENNHGIGLDLLLQGLRASLVEMEVGENEIHDIPVKRAELEVDLFYKAVHEGRLFVKDFSGQHQVDLIMFRKDIVNDILNNHYIDEYVGEANGNAGRENCYQRRYFKDYLSELPALLNAISDARKCDSFFGFCHSDLPRLGHLDRVLANEYRFSQLIRPFAEVAACIAIDQQETANEILVGWLTMSFLDHFMGTVRKIWSPGCHEGSQDNDETGYRLLSKTINAALDRNNLERELEQEFDEKTSIKQKFFNSKHGIGVVFYDLEDKGFARVRAGIKNAEDMPWVSLDTLYDSAEQALNQPFAAFNRHRATQDPSMNL